jgi:hypothetical protein
MASIRSKPTNSPSYRSRDQRPKSIARRVMCHLILVVYAEINDYDLLGWRCIPPLNLVHSSTNQRSAAILPQPTHSDGAKPIALTPGLNGPIRSGGDNFRRYLPCNGALTDSRQKADPPPRSSPSLSLTAPSVCPQRCPRVCLNGGGWRRRGTVRGDAYTTG